MGLASWLFGTGGETTAKAVDAIGNALDKLVTSDEERAAAALALEKLRQAPDALQVELNKIEAAHPSILVAGWRPALGWVCVASLAMYYPVRIAVGMLVWVITVFKSGVLTPMPDVGIADIMGLAFSLLGMSGIRAWEKSKDVAR